MKCDWCGESYEDFRTGLTFTTVRRMMWTCDPDPSTWRQKRRHGVLGFWRQLKLQQWTEYHRWCDGGQAE